MNRSKSSFRPLAVVAALVVLGRAGLSPAEGPKDTLVIQVAAAAAASIRITLEDNFAATGGGAGCVNIGARSLINAAGSSGTSNLGTYNVGLTVAPTGAQGCLSPTMVYAIQTFRLSIRSNGGARVDMSRDVTSSWSVIKFAQSTAANWTSDATGTTLTASPQAVINGIPNGNRRFDCQIAWGVALNAPSGAKSGIVTITLFQP